MNQFLIIHCLMIALAVPGWWGHACCCQQRLSQAVASAAVESPESLPPCCAARLQRAQDLRQSLKQDDGISIRARCGCQPREVLSHGARLTASRQVSSLLSPSLAALPPATFCPACPPASSSPEPLRPETGQPPDAQARLISLCRWLA